MPCAGCSTIIAESVDLSDVDDLSSDSIRYLLHKPVLLISVDKLSSIAGRVGAIVELSVAWLVPDDGFEVASGG